MNRDIFNKKFNLLGVEKSLLALILTRRGVIDDVVTILKKDDFENGSDTVNKTVYDLCLKCFDRYKYVSIPAVIDEIKNSGVVRLTSVANMDISQYIESLGVMIIRDDNHKGLANILKEASVRRKIFIATSEIQYNLLNTPFDNPNISISKAEKIFSECVSRVDRGSDRPINIYQDIAEALEETKNQDFSTKGYPCPYPTVQNIFGSLTRPGNITLFTSRSGVGKALADYENVRMADGSLKRICDLKKGNEVFSVKGQKARVLGVFPQGRKNMIKFYWEDGRNPTVSSYDHLWEVCSFINKKKKIEVITSAEIARRLKGGEKLYIPTSYFVKKNIYKKAERKDYVLLGKYFRDGKIEDEEYEHLSNLFPDMEGLKDRALDKIDFERFPLYGRVFFIKEYIKENPQFYIQTDNSSLSLAKDDRLGIKTKIRFSTEDNEYANLIINIFRSVGGFGKVNFSSKKKKFDVTCFTSKYGEYKLCKNKVGIHSRYVQDYIKIYDARPIGKLSCTCILVNNPSHLFLLENNILTHNTQITMDIATKVSETYKVPILHFDNGEMSERELQYRRLSALSGVNYYDIESGKWCKSPQSVAKLKQALLATEGKEMFYYQVAGKSYEEMRDLIKSFYDNVCHGGQMIFCYDYMKPSQNGTFNEQEHQYLGRLMDKFKTLIHDEIKVDRKPVISMLTSVQSNKLGIVAKKTFNEMEDSENVFGLSDRLIHYASHCAILRNITNDEYKLQGPNFGTHKLIFIKGRFLGEDVSGYLNLVNMPDGSVRRNSINLDFKNFSIEDKGDLRDIVRSFSANNTPIKKEKGYTVPF